MDNVANTAAPAHAPRIAPATPPFAPEIEAWLTRTMPPGQPPLRLFTTLARDPRLFQKFFSAGLLDRGNLTLRQREIVIHRTTALCGSEYEWGVHVAIFAARVGFDAVQLQSLAGGTPEDACWPPDEADLLRLCEALHRTCTVEDTLWQSIASRFSDEAMLELADARRLLPRRELPDERVVPAARTRCGAGAGRHARHQAAGGNVSMKLGRALSLSASFARLACCSRHAICGKRKSR